MLENFSEGKRTHRVVWTVNQFGSQLGQVVNNHCSDRNRQTKKGHSKTCSEMAKGEAGAGLFFVRDSAFAMGER